MQNVVLLTPEEYAELVEIKDAVENRMRELEELVENKDALQEYVKDWLF